LRSDYRFQETALAKLKLVKRSKDVQPAPPSAPTPPAREPQTARSDAESRHHRVSVAAYYRAERRGFAPGGEEQDWLEAEKDLDRTSISAA
jgi:hypothetical protein